MGQSSFPRFSTLRESQTSQQLVPNTPATAVLVEVALFDQRSTWFMVLFCLYSVLVELVRVLGKKRMVKLFFGRG